MNQQRHTVSCFSLLALALVSAVGCTETIQGPAAGDGTATPEGGIRFFLPTGEPDNTSAPTVEVDAQGNTHAIYPAYAIGGAYYAFCGPGCSSPETTKVVHFETDGTVANAMLALDKQGRPRVLLSSYSKIYWASCDADCGEQASWSVSMILDHNAEREVSGEALALDPEGRPRFLMHTYRAFLGIGQKAPETLWVACDANCGSPESWKQSVIQTEIWQGTHLRFDENGVAKVATVTDLTIDDVKVAYAAYVECAADCTTEEAWKGIGLGPAYSTEYDAVAIKPTVSLALTKAGAPRIAFMAKNEDSREIRYMGCDSDCSEDHWAGLILSDNSELAVGLDLALDANDAPRIAYNLDFNIFLATCDNAHCETGDHPWDLKKVEAGSDMPPDQIFLYENCTVGAWFLHSPSIALTASGEPRVGYQARDISGGWNKPNPQKADCVAGTDMTWSRLAFLPR
ncbi:MAG TPA: hypothetical protein VM580_15425 [Labilithrix sp.]|nr:hypothetical protein [Labilithrix sp.]